MKNKLFLFVYISMFLVSGIFATTQYNSQLQMIGARSASLGGTVPTLAGDLNASFVNPAVLGEIEEMQLAYSYQNIFGNFVYNQINFCMPFLDMNLGVSYGSDMLYDIPETVYENSRIRLKDTYSAGFNVLKGSLAKTFYQLDFMDNIDKVSVGSNLKLYQQKVGDYLRYGVGWDIGALMSMSFKNNTVEKLHVGVAIVDLLSYMQNWNGVGIIKNDNFARKYFFGMKADMLEDTFSVFFQNSVDGYSLPLFNNVFHGFSLGAEYKFPANLYLRTSTDTKRLNVGTGIRFDNIMGFNMQDYSMQVDYNYTFNTAPMDSLPTHLLTFSILGEDRSLTPKILYPLVGFLTKDEVLNMRGVAAKKAKILIFNNKQLYKTIEADKYGYWTVEKFPLVEGENKIYIQANGIEKEVSFKSKELVVFSDNQVPTVDIKVLLVEGGQKLKFVMTASEKLADIKAGFNDKQCAFLPVSDLKWEAFVDLPDFMKNDSFINEHKALLEVTVRDKAGNEAGPIEKSFFLQLENPKDKSIQYKNHLTILGNVSSSVKALKIDNEFVKWDKNYAFSLPYKLKLGKNLLNFKVYTLNNTVLNYKARVLKLKTYTDLIPGTYGKLEAEALATLGILEGVSNTLYNPEYVLKRIDIAKLIVRLKNMKLPLIVTKDFKDLLANNVSTKYAVEMVEKGIMLPDEKNKFRPYEVVKAGELKTILNKAGFKMNNLSVYADDEVVTRLKLAVMLANTDEYAAKVNDLLK